MRIKTNSVVHRGIGALELKRNYQRNMLLAIVVAAGTALGLMGAVALYVALQPNPVRPPGTIIINPRVIDDVFPVGRLVQPPPISREHLAGAVPTIGIPTPMPDEQVPEEIAFVRPETFIPPQGFSADSLRGLPLQGGLDFQIEHEERFPTPTEFVSVDEFPVQAYTEPPVYPALAGRAGIEGEVWVRAMIDTEGRVRDAIIQQSSGTKAGFEDAALAAAHKCRYRPAMQNKRPVALWVSYKVVFELK